MSSTDKTVIAFDLYGTLLSTESIAKELATHFGDDKAQKIATLWRRYQLEYTWRMNSMSMLPLTLMMCPHNKLQISTNHSATLTVPPSATLSPKPLKLSPKPIPIV